MRPIWNQIEILRIDKATDEVVPAIIALANKVTFSNASEKERQGGFLFPYTAAQYRDFTQRAEHFYILCLGKKLIGFVLAHSSEKNDFFWEEAYLHIKGIQARPFIAVRQICIAPEFSNRGYGRKLYDFLFRHIEKDITRYRTAICFIWKRPPNTASEKFHRSVGWKEIDTYTLKNGSGVVGIWARTIQPCAASITLSDR